MKITFPFKKKKIYSKMMLIPNALTLAFSWLIIFNLIASIVPSFISDSSTSSGVITEEAMQITTTIPNSLKFKQFERSTLYVHLQFQCAKVRSISMTKNTSIIVSKRLLSMEESAIKPKQEEAMRNKGWNYPKKICNLLPGISQQIGHLKPFPSED